METEGFLVTEGVHPSSWVFPTHHHKLAFIGIVLKGSYTEIISKRPQECGPHSLQFLPAGEPHSYAFGRAGIRCLSIEIKPHRLEGIRQFSLAVDQAVHKSQGLSSLVLRLYKEFCLGNSASVLTIEGLILETLGDASRLNPRCSLSAEPRWLRQARDFIHENATGELSLIGVAADAGVHPTYLARMFRRFYGCSVGEYVRRFRLDYAVRELTESDRSLAEIAVAAGFYDQSHFTHEFRLHLNLTPARFRAIVQLGRSNSKSLRFSKTE
jgi:AraC-like DNA-binding protein